MCTVTQSRSGSRPSRSRALAASLAIRSDARTGAPVTAVFDPNDRSDTAYVVHTSSTKGANNRFVSPGVTLISSSAIRQRTIRSTRRIRAATTTGKQT